MSVRQDQDRIIETLHRRVDDLDSNQLRSVYEQLLPAVAPPAARLLPRQGEPTRSEVQALLSHWVEVGGAETARHVAQEEEERTMRDRPGTGPSRRLEGGDGGHLDTDRRATMSADFVPDSAVVGGSLQDDGRSGGMAMGGDGTDEGDDGTEQGGGG
ncbi:MAG: hypothetical protein RMK29_00935 [Myxococcales bacterium]|nr:hypothetical protein [Myxococcota bacterium]MDW8280243.1 hypothetical protein [Myxococcales bacterium]